VSAAALTTILIGTAVAFLAPLQLWASAAPSLPRGSRWLGVAALGSTGVAIALALLYESRSVEQALLARRLVPILFAPLYVGVVRFSEGHLDTRLRGNALFVCGMIGAVTVASFVPGAIYIEQPVLRTIWLPRTQYVDVGVSRFVLTLGLTMVPPVFQLVQAHRRHAVDRGRGWRTGFAVISIWSLCVANDIAAFLGVIATPFVLPLGNACIVVALTFIVLLRFVKALASVEAEAALLQQLVDQRAHELRERDLQIAQGVPLAAAGTLAAGLAHELNNPLAFVVANLNQLEGLRKDPAAHAEFEQVLLETREGTARMRSILTQLDGLARGRAADRRSGSGVPRFQECGHLADVLVVNLAAAADQARTLVGERARRAAHELRVHARHETVADAFEAARVRHRGQHHAARLHRGSLPRRAHERLGLPGSETVDTHQRRARGSGFGDVLERVEVPDTIVSLLPERQMQRDRRTRFDLPRVTHQRARAFE